MASRRGRALRARLRRWRDEADFRKALFALPWRDRLKLLREMWAFIATYAKFGWGKQILREAAWRELKRQYDSRRWV